jgi:O-antigen ligase
MRTVAFWLSLILIFVIPWENSLMLEAVGTASRIVGLVVAGFWVVKVIVKGEFRRPHPFHIAFYLFLAWNMISVFWSVDIEMTMSRLNTYSQMFFFILILWDIYTTPVALETGQQAYVLGAYVSIGSTVYSYLTSNALHGRYSGAGFGANDLGLILSLGIPLAWHLAVSQNTQSGVARGLKVINYAYLPSALFAILLTGSRGSLLSAVPGMLFVLGSLTRLKLSMRLLVFAVVVSAGLILLPLIPQTSFQRIATTGESLSENDWNGRVAIWREGLAIVQEHPLRGIGSGAFKAAAVVQKKVAHNVFISVLTELGLIGFILFAAIVIITVHQAVRQPKWAAQLWLSVLLIWGLGALVHTWEQRKQTWLFLSLVIVSANLALRSDVPRQRPQFVIRSIGRLKGGTVEPDSAIPSPGAADLGHLARYDNLSGRYDAGRTGQHVPGKWSRANGKSNSR